MISQTFRQSFLFLLIMLGAAGFASGKVIFIKPLPTESCSQDQEPCLTPSQFATNFSCISNDSNDSAMDDKSITLHILPGTHSLDVVVSVSCAENFSMMGAMHHNKTVSIDCDWTDNIRFGCLEISGASFVLISEIHFIGCGGNRVTNIVHFVLKDTVFQDAHDSVFITSNSSISINTSNFINNNGSYNYSYCYLQSNAGGVIRAVNNCSIDPY